MNLKVWGGHRGCDWLCVFIMGVQASWERCWRDVKPNRLTNYKCLFWLRLSTSHCSVWMREHPWQIKQDAPLGWLSFKASNQKQLSAKWEQPRWHPYPTVWEDEIWGAFTLAVSSKSRRVLPKTLVNINAFSGTRWHKFISVKLP